MFGSGLKAFAYYYNFLDIKGLPLGCLEDFSNWINKKFLPQELPMLKKNLATQINFYKKYPTLENFLIKLVYSDEDTR
ncbi:Uncharacterised protein [Legionella busanensis]|uniref:Uncharacterized protein n=1 Tax=Legionella busanensis TaxID=190655 RepID=A0A378JNA9_9GAMM|nr:Uncharacterised protein [Legionella busanensis]